MRIPTILISIALTVTASAVGCAVDNTPTDEALATDNLERRQKIGKADLWGSCELDGAAQCGKKSTGNCYCDKACVGYGDCCADFNDVCGEGESGSCADVGGACLSSPIDVTFGANCVADYGVPQLDGACAAFNQTCCALVSECQPVVCQLFCEYGFKTGADGCAICSCAEAPIECGGFAGLECPAGKTCVDFPGDSCDPQNGGADCGGICVDAAPAPSCQGKCGGVVGNKDCFCDDLCSQYGDCCSDYDAFCADDREPASGMCVKNSGDACSTDADCVSGGCGGELCYNPAMGGGISTCECTTPTDVAGCGCVDGQCSWYN